MLARVRSALSFLLFDVFDSSSTVSCLAFFISRLSSASWFVLSFSLSVTLCVLDPFLILFRLCFSLESCDGCGVSFSSIATSSVDNTGVAKTPRICAEDASTGDGPSSGGDMMGVMRAVSRGDAAKGESMSTEVSRDVDINSRG